MHPWFEFVDHCFKNDFTNKIAQTNRVKLMNTNRIMIFKNKNNIVKIELFQQIPRNIKTTKKRI